jgi:hypothetical protein
MQWRWELTPDMGVPGASRYGGAFAGEGRGHGFGQYR